MHDQSTYRGHVIWHVRQPDNSFLYNCAHTPLRTTLEEVHADIDESFIALELLCSDGLCGRNDPSDNYEQHSTLNHATQGLMPKTR